MNLKLYITGGLFVLSELMPYLPCRGNGVFHIALSTLHKIKVLPDAEFEKMERKAGFDMDSDGMIGKERVTKSEDEETVIEIRINRRKV